MKNHYTRSLIAAIIFVFLLACGKAKLKPLEPLDVLSGPRLINVNADFCTQPPDNVQSNLKFIIVVDKSGSNHDIPPDEGTDPNGYRRYTPLIAYLQDAVADPLTFYSMVNFSTTAQKLNMGTVAAPLDFTNDKDAFLNIVRKQQDPGGLQKLTPPQPPVPNDAGWTDYLGALLTVQTMIDADIRAAKAAAEIKSSSYVVVFISDGAPITGQNNDGTPIYQAKADVVGAVKNILALEAASKEYVDAIQVHTAYYYGDVPDAQAQSYMADAATAGNGDSYQFSKGQVIDFKKFAVPERRIKYNLRDIIVSNMSTVWEDGLLKLDSDYDGLSDDLEAKLGSNPFLADSDGNGVSDLVEYLSTGKPCKDAACTPALAEPYVTCNEYIKTQTLTAKTYTDKDHDGLNDCEEQVILKSKDDNAFTGGGYIPDDLAFRNRFSLSQSVGEGTLDSASDGMTNYAKLKQHLPIFYPITKIIGLKPYNYNLTLVSSNSEQSCYRSEVSNVTVLGANDLVRVFLTQSSATLDEKKVLTTAEKVVPPGVTAVNFVMTDFK